MNSSTNYSCWKQHIPFLARALISSLIICFPTLLNYFRSGSHSMLIYSEYDESYYLLIAKKLGQTPLSEIFSNTFNPISQITAPHFEVPHDLLLYVIGYFLYFFKIHPTILVLALNLICSFTCYAIFTSIFKKFGTQQLLAEVGAAIFIGTPWLSSIFFLLDFDFVTPLTQTKAFVTTTTIEWACLPILRGPMTQISIVLIGLFTFYFLNVFKKSSSYRDCIIAGFIGGFCIYAYFFSWVFLGSIIFSLTAFTIFLKFLFPDNTQYNQFTKKLFLTSVTFSLICIPGVCFILLRRSFLQDSFIIPSYLPKTIFFSPSAFLSIAIFSTCLFCKKLKCIEKELVAITVLLLSYLLIYNIQFFTKAYLQTFHFFPLFLAPILSSFLIITIAKMLSFSRVRILWFLSVFCLPFFSSSLLLQRTFYPSEYIKDVQELISSAELYVPEGSSIMFDHPQVVFWETTSLQLATNRNVVTLAPYDNYLNTLKEGIHREAWIRYIYKDFDRKDYDLANHGAMTTDELLVSIYKSADIFHYQYLLLKQKPIKELTTRMQSDPVLRKAPCQYLIITKPEFMNIKIETEEVIIKPLWVSHAKIFEIAEVTEKDI